MPRAISGLVEAGVGLVPGWGGCKELLSRGADHPASGRAARCRRSPGLRDHLHCAKVAELGRRGEASCCFLRPTRRHHHEPRPAAGRRQGARRWRWPRTISRPSRSQLRLPGADRPRRPSGLAVDDFVGSGQGHAPMTRVVAEQPGRGADRRRHRPRPRTLAEDEITPLERRSLHGACSGRRRRWPAWSTRSTPASRCGIKER